MEPPVASQPETPRRTRLMLKDGSFQWVLSYKVVGDVVRYRSAERDGAQEDVPLSLVDMAATKAWEAAHDPNAPHPAVQQAPVLSPELAREEAARLAQERRRYGRATRGCFGCRRRTACLCWTSSRARRSLFRFRNRAAI